MIFAIKHFVSLSKFQDLGYEFSVEDDVVFLWKDTKEHYLNTITFSTRRDSLKTYTNKGLTMDELDAITLFWIEYNELIENYERG